MGGGREGRVRNLLQDSVLQLLTVLCAAVRNEMGGIVTDCWGMLRRLWLQLFKSARGAKGVDRLYRRCQPEARNRVRSDDWPYYR